MTVALYTYSVPVFLRHLAILQNVLDMAEKNAVERKIDPSVFVNARLAPDMLPLARQIQIATDGAKGCGARLAGVEIPSFADTETTFDELRARIAKTVEFLSSLKADAMQGDENRDVVVKIKGEDRHFKAVEYLQTFAVPNFYFHVSIAYAILRAQGVPIGKMDYLGALNAA